MNGLITIAQLTVHEAMRRRILAASLACGAAFLVLFAIGLHFALREVQQDATLIAPQRAMLLNFFTLAGLYAVNFLTVMSAVLLPVDTLSGEIDSGVIQTLASKPVRRSTVVLGKWLAYALVVIGYLVFLAGGVMGVAWVVGRFSLPNPLLGLSLMTLEALVLVSVSLAGSAHLSTVTAGVVTFGLFGLAFVGNWVEQIGTALGNAAAQNVGTVASLIMPSESLWMLAAYHMQPPLMTQLQLTPLSPVSVPSPASVVWALLYVLGALAFALRSFAKRPL